MRVLYLIAVSVFLIVLFDLAVADDAYEENDDMSSAARISEGLFNLTAEDEDWYYGEIDDIGGIEIWIAFNSSEVDLDLYLYDANGTEIANSTSSGDREYISLEIREKGRYYGRVVPVSGQGNYTMSISFWNGTYIWGWNWENGTDGWSFSGFWHMVNRTSNYTNRFSPWNATWYGNESTGNYDDGSRNSGYLTSPLIDLEDYPNPILMFWSWYETEESPGYDVRYVEVSTDGLNWTTIHECDDTAMRNWTKITVRLAGYSGLKIYLRFSFDTIDDIDNDYRGWYIDDIQIRDRTLFVDDDNAGDPQMDGTREHPYDMIQKAIDNATGGEVIWVHNGTYYERLNIDISVFLVGNGSYVTHVMGDGSGSVVTILANNVTMHGFSVNGSGSQVDDAGVKILSNGVFLYGLDIHGNYHGILANEVSTIFIIRCHIHENVQSGISIGWSELVVINNTDIHGCEEGIYSVGSFYLQIIDTSLYNNTYGIFHEYGQYFWAMYADFYNNTWGLYMNNSDVGSLVKSSLHRNDLGLTLINTTNVTVMLCEIFLNSGYGAYLDGSNSNVLYLNNFCNNTHQAYDSGGNNSWDDGWVGNYWSDYNGTDSDGDGIGDTPYYIDGTSGARDRYPLINMTETGAPKRIPEMNALILPMTGALLIYAIWRRRQAQSR